VADDVPWAAHSTARHGVDGPKVVDGGLDPKVAFFLGLFGDEKRLIHGELDSKI